MARKPLPKYQASFNKVYGRYKINARNRKIEFHLTPSYFRYLCEQDCTFCDAPPNNNIKSHDTKLNGAWKFNGLDRVDNTLGYVVGNVQPCCTMCNKLKSNLEEEVFLRHITRIVKLKELKSIKED